MFKDALARVRAAVFERPLIVTNNNYRFMAKHQLAEIGVSPFDILLEPARRNTAASMAVAALHLHAKDPDAIMLALPSDHYFKNFNFFFDFLKLVDIEKLKKHIVIFGAQPTSASTQYGYIEKGKSTSPLSPVISFKEKPEEAVAKTYAESGNYLWNIGMFFSRADTFLNYYRQHAPDILALTQESLTHATPDLGFLRLDSKSFEKLPDISFDYAIMNKTAESLVFQGDIEWNDLGTLEAFAESISQKQGGNLLSDHAVAIDSTNCRLISKKQLLVCQNLNNVQVIAEDDVVYISPADAPADNKILFESIQSEGYKKFLTSGTRDYRPWGKFEILAEATNYKIKKLSIDMGQSISLQKHQLRHEHWVVIEGEVLVTRGADKITLRQGESTFIPINLPHKIENIGDKKAEIIEIQLGTSFDEEDIVRLDDKYSRK